MAEPLASHGRGAGAERWGCHGLPSTRRSWPSRRGHVHRQYRRILEEAESCTAPILYARVASLRANAVRAEVHELEAKVALEKELHSIRRQPRTGKDCDVLASQRAERWGCHGLPSTVARASERHVLASPADHRPRSSRRCSKAGICAPSARCTGSWPRTSRCESGERSHPCYTKPGWWPRGPTRPGPGTSPGSGGPNAGRPSTSMSCSTSSAATSWAGWLPGRTPPLAATLIEETCLKQGIEPQVLTLHSDRGARR